MHFERARIALASGIALVLIISAMATMPAHAQTAGNSSAGLVPCGAPSAGLTGDQYVQASTSCNLCSFIGLIQKIINFLIGISIPLAVALFAYAGVLYFTSAGNLHQVEKAHGVFRSVGIGFILILTAWIIVDTFIHAIVVPNFFQGIGGNWYTISCTEQIGGSGGRQINGTLGSWFSKLFGARGTQQQQPPGSAPSITGGTQTSGNGGAVPTQASVSQGNSGIEIPGISSTDANGNPVTLGFTPTRSYSDLQNSYVHVNDVYGFQIDDACNTYGGNIPNCPTVIASVITVESGGNPNAKNGSSVGLMQVAPGTAGSSCSVSNTTCNINTGTKYLSQLYGKYNDLANAFAGYNSGPTETPGQSPSGKNSGLVASVDCPGEYAWQCATNPGGLTTTQNYIANICAVAYLNGVNC